MHERPSLRVTSGGAAYAWTQWKRRARNQMSDSTGRCGTHALTSAHGREPIAAGAHC
jgi:hypothetical protein